MTSTTFFIVFIPILSILLLIINLLLAPHFPYQEKDSAFECGFHSFLGQNRTQFSISFFIFGLLFLLFDLEIILVYPYSVSGYSNDGYGLTIVMIFFISLALGFIFELGKNALSIDSKQSFLPDNNNTQILDVFITDVGVQPLLYTSLPLQSRVPMTPYFYNTIVSKIQKEAVTQVNEKVPGVKASKIGSFIVNIIVSLNIHSPSPSPHKFYSVGLHSGGWDTQSLKELLFELKKLTPLHKETYMRYKSIEHDLKMLDKAKALDDKISDKSKNGEMNKIISYYETYFDEDSGNTREEGIKQVKEYLKEEEKSHLNSYKNIKMKIDNLQKEIDKRKAVEENQKVGEETKKALDNNQNSFLILPIFPINSFTIIRILLSIFSWFIYFKFIDFDINYLIPNMPDVTIPMIFTSIVLFAWEYYKLYSKVRKYYKLGKIIYVFCKEKLSLITRIVNNSAGKFY
jgi:NADH-ubiquinone oxidoreductase chain 3